MFSGDNINVGDAGDAAKIFVGGLDWNTTVDELKAYFEEFGAIVDCSIKADHYTGRSRGFGFVTFADPAVVDVVLNTRCHNLNGKVIDPKRVKFKAVLDSLKKIFVGGLDTTITEEMIREYFGKFGTIDELDLPYDRTTNERRRFCFIRFTSNDPVERLCAVATKHTINGKLVEVKKAMNKAELASLTPSFGGGSYAQLPHGYGRGSYGASADSSWGLPLAGNGYDSNVFSGYDGGYYGHRQPSSAAAGAASSSFMSYGGNSLSTVGGYGGAQTAEMNYSIPSYHGGLSGRDRAMHLNAAAAASLPGIGGTVRPGMNRGRGSAAAAMRYQPYSLQ
jgi:hypothetical protein